MQIFIVADPDFQLQFWRAGLVQKNAFKMWGTSLSLLKASKDEADLPWANSHASLPAMWLLSATGLASSFWPILGWNCSQSLICQCWVQILTLTPQPWGSHLIHKMLSHLKSNDNETSCVVGRINCYTVFAGQVPSTVTGTLWA